MRFADFTSLVRPETPGAPDFLIERAVRETAIDFCRRTGVYIPEPENITVIKGINEYDVTVPAVTELNYITDVFELSYKFYCRQLLTLSNDVCFLNVD